jgi:membrane-associated phospholipid phosphatase
MRGRQVGLTTAWLVLVAAAQILAFVALWRLAVDTGRGQALDTIALTGNRIGRDRIAEPIGTVLDAVSAVTLLAATAFVGFIALIRGRIALAVVTTVLIAGANITTQLLKHLIQRPELGIDPERDWIGNSLPSGHTTVAASVAVALVLALPRRLRAVGAVLAAAYAALTGVATVSAGWHRPSDAITAILVVGAWAALAGIVLLLTQREDARVGPEDAHQLATALLVLAALGFLAVAAAAIIWTGDVLDISANELPRRRLLVAYVGGAAAIAGTASLVMALVLSTVHRVVPRNAG